MGKRHESIERMKTITTEYLTTEKFVIENGTLVHAGIETNNEIAIVSTTVVFNSGGACIIGSRSAGEYIPTYKSIQGSRYGFEAMLWLMAVAGVDRSEDLVGRRVRVAFDKDGLAQYIGHITNDIWFSFDDLASGIADEDNGASEVTDGTK